MALAFSCPKEGPVPPSSPRIIEAQGRYMTVLHVQREPAAELIKAQLTRDCHNTGLPLARVHSA